MTPDGTPVVGPTPIANLYLATGHGTLGWTMAAGTGRVMADLISGRQAEIDLDGLTLDALPARARATRFHQQRSARMNIIQTADAPQAIGPYSQAIASRRAGCSAPARFR